METYTDALNGLLTKRGQARLTRYIEGLIDVAAQGNTWPADFHAYDVATIVTKHRRKRAPKS